MTKNEITLYNAHRNERTKCRSSNHFDRIAEVLAFTSIEDQQSLGKSISCNRTEFETKFRGRKSYEVNLII
jgi:hypothetical protein